MCKTAECKRGEKTWLSFCIYFHGSQGVDWPIENNHTSEESVTCKYKTPFQWSVINVGLYLFSLFCRIDQVYDYSKYLNHFYLVVRYFPHGRTDSKWWFAAFWSVPQNGWPYLCLMVAESGLALVLLKQLFGGWGSTNKLCTLDPEDRISYRCSGLVSRLISGFG